MVHQRHGLSVSGAFTTSSGRVRLDWSPDERLVLMSFPREGETATEADAGEAVARMASWAGGEPLRLLVDCRGLASTDAGWRAEFAGFFRGRGWRDRVAWAHMNPLVGMMVTMFVRATRLEGRSFRGVDEARTWLLARPLEARAS